MHKRLRTILMLVAIASPWTSIRAQETKRPGEGADACVLVSKAEIEKVIGVRLNEGQKDPKLQRTGSLSTCDYSAVNGGRMSILIRHNSSKYVPGSEKSELEKAGMKMRMIQDLGTIAFFADISGSDTALSVLRGDYDFVLITAIGMNGTLGELSSDLEDLARLILERWK